MLSPHCENEINTFNLHGKKALQSALFKNSFQSTTALANYLYQNRAALSGEHLGEILSDPLNIELLSEYVKHFQFLEKDFHRAMKTFLEQGGFHLPKEAQAIDRLIAAFSAHYHQSHPEDPLSVNAHIVAFSALLLNTDLHNPKIKASNKRTEDSFVQDLIHILLNERDRLVQEQNLYQHLALQFKDKNSLEKIEVLKAKRAILNKKRDLDYNSLSEAEKREGNQIQAELQEYNQFLKLEKDTDNRVKAISQLQKHLTSEGMMALKKSLTELYYKIKYFQFCLENHPKQSHICKRAFTATIEHLRTLPLILLSNLKLLAQYPSICLQGSYQKMQSLFKKFAQSNDQEQVAAPTTLLAAVEEHPVQPCVPVAEEQTEKLGRLRPAALANVEHPVQPCAPAAEQTQTLGRLKQEAALDNIEKLSMQPRTPAAEQTETSGRLKPAVLGKPKKQRSPAHYFMPAFSRHRPKTRSVTKLESLGSYFDANDKRRSHRLKRS